MNNIIKEFSKSKTLKNKRILIIGFGVTGRSLQKFCEHFGANVFFTDQKHFSDKAYVSLEELTSSDHLSYDLVLKSPGVPWTDEVLKFCQMKEMFISGEIDLVSQVVNAPIIAVTGTNGKSSVVKMISESLKALGIKHFLGGNYGIAFSEVINDLDVEFVVLELSSFQLELMKEFRAELGLITNLSAHHLERYEKVEDYFDEKIKLSKMSQSFFIGENLGAEVQKKIYGKYLECENFELDWSKMRVKGEHNQRNFNSCFSLIKALGFNEHLFQDIIENFQGLSHRLEYCGKVKTIEFYNDSKSTSLEATLTALKSFSLKERAQLKLLLGGKIRTHDVSSYKEILNFIKPHQIYLYGESREICESVFKQSKCFKDIDEIFSEIRTEESHKAIVLLSPGFPSFDQFQNFEKRGEYFKQKIHQLI